MCGIVGIVEKERRDLLRLVGDMSDAMIHRGPDDRGSWSDEELGVAFGQRRLAILDLTEHGRQPMHSSDGRFTINYNGEVYNYQEIGQELKSEGRVLHSRCDTEVVLEAVAAWGFETAIGRLNGMFALAVIDRKERALHLARDHLGIKPLFFGWNGGTFFFASELKPLQRHPGIQLEVDRSSLALALRYNCIPAPHSIYRNVYKLLPGCTLTLPLETLFSGRTFSPWPEDSAEWRPKRFWNPREVCQAAQAQGWSEEAGNPVDALEGLLKDSVRRQMISDVPLGVFLSGGIDSSTIAAIAGTVSNHAIRTFSIGFEEEGFDEAPYAAAVARHLNTDHTELYVSGKQALDVVPRLPLLFDEPFSDSSQIPTYLVSKLARNSVTVALSGDGGDELFCGYTRYPAAQAKWSTLSKIPLALRRSTARLLRSVAPKSDRMAKLIAVFEASAPEQYYSWVLSHWKEPTSIVPESGESLIPLTDHRQWPSGLSAIDLMMFLDTIAYLPDDLLVKGDRASMAASLEVRVPLLDFRIVELAWRLPISMKLRNGRNKWILREVLSRYVPPKLIERPKKGFSVPVAAWLRGPLREWAEDLLDARHLEDRGLLRSAPIREKWQEHLSGRADWDAQLWDVLMIQAWLREYAR